MRGLILLFALGLAACQRETQDNYAIPAPVTSEATLPAADPTQQSARVVPMPKDQVQLDRMILAGFTPHGDHLHPPGVNKCPLSNGTEAVM